jgi:acyl-coenzyme A thioesterase PaaI-like protein
MPSRDKMQRQSTNKCFGCGQENPVGLRLSFRSEGNKVKAEFIPTELYQGYPGYLHGGIICAILDEAMGWAAYSLSSGILPITATAQVKFKRPILIDEPLLVTAAITRRTKRLMWTRATISRKDGTVAAEGTASMVVGEGD